jgi:hypothetical protein
LDSCHISTHLRVEAVLGGFIQMKMCSKLLTLAVVAGIFSATSAANAALVLDLRLAPGQNGLIDSKNLIPTAGQVITLNVVGVATGADANLTNEGIANAYFSVLSNSTLAGIKGNLSAATLNSTLGYNGAGSASGTVVDLNGDGNLDVGATNSASATGWVFARSPAVVVGNELLLATLTFTVGTLGDNGAATVNIAPRVRTGPTVVPAQWQEDGVAKSLTVNNTTVDVGAAVTIGAAAPIPEPASLGVLGLGVIGLLVRRRK